MRLGQLAEETREGSALDITPLIDIVFILLIFFVVTTTFVHDLGIDVERHSRVAVEAHVDVVRRRQGDRAAALHGCGGRLGGRPWIQWCSVTSCAGPRNRNVTERPLTAGNVVRAISSSTAVAPRETASSISSTRFIA